METWAHLEVARITADLCQNREQDPVNDSNRALVDAIVGGGGSITKLVGPRASFVTVGSAWLVTAEDRPSLVVVSGTTETKFSAVLLGWNREDRFTLAGNAVARIGRWRCNYNSRADANKVFDLIGRNGINSSQPLQLGGFSAGGMVVECMAAMLEYRQANGWFTESITTLGAPAGLSGSPRSGQGGRRRVMLWGDAVPTLPVCISQAGIITAFFQGVPRRDSADFMQSAGGRLIGSSGHVIATQTPQTVTSNAWADVQTWVRGGDAAAGFPHRPASYAEALVEVESPSIDPSTAEPELVRQEPDHAAAVQQVIREIPDTEEGPRIYTAVLDVPGSAQMVPPAPSIPYPNLETPVQIKEAYSPVISRIDATRFEVRLAGSLICETTNLSRAKTIRAAWKRLFTRMSTATKIPQATGADAYQAQLGILAASPEGIAGKIRVV